METSHQFFNAMPLYIYPLHNRVPLSPGMLFSPFLYDYIPEITQLTVPLSLLKLWRHWNEPCLEEKMP